MQMSRKSPVPLSSAFFCGAAAGAQAGGCWWTAAPDPLPFEAAGARASCPHRAAIGRRRLLPLLLLLLLQVLAVHMLLSWMGRAGPGLKGPLMHPNMGIRSMASAECTSSRRVMHDLVQVALGHLQVMVQQWNWRHVQRPRQGMLQRSPLLKQTRHLALKLLVLVNGEYIPGT